MTTRSAPGGTIRRSQTPEPVPTPPGATPSRRRRAGKPAGAVLMAVGEIVSEADFERKVVDLAHHFGWLVAHFGIGWSTKGYRTPARYDGAGFPDLVLVHKERHLVWFRELKAGRRPHRPLDDAQQAWYDQLAEAGANVDVWRPGDWPDIVSSLSNGRAVPQ
jgi:hypothetical protein